MSMSMPAGDDDDAGEVMCEMNTTPLIDVMLVLLIMLIITIPIQTHAVKLDMPKKSASSASNEPPKVVEIVFTPDGAIKWNGEVVALGEDLDARITEAAELTPPPEVHLRPDRSSRYELVAKVMASTQRLGLKKIGVTGNEQYAQNL